MVTTGDIFPDYWTPAFEDLTTVTAFNKVSETVDEYKRLISSGGSLSKAIQSAEKFEKSIASGGDIYQAIQTAKGLATTVSGTNGLSTQVSQLAGSYAIKSLTSSGDMINQINLNKDGSIKFDGSLIRITGKTVIDNGVIKSAMIANGQIGTAHIGTIDASKANIINLNVKNIVGLDATFIKSKIELAIIDWMKGKTILANNDAMKIDLNGGQILHYTEKAAMKRILTDYPTQFIKFATGTKNNVQSGIVVVGSNRWVGSGESHSDGGFVGFRIWNGMRSTNEVDIIEAIGDEFIMTAGANENNGFIFNTAGFGFVPKVKNKAFLGDSSRYFERGEFGNIYLHQNGNRVNLVQLLRNMGANI